MTATPPAFVGWIPLSAITRRLDISYTRAYRRAAAGLFGEPMRVGNTLLFDEARVNAARQQMTRTLEPAVA